MSDQWCVCYARCSTDQGHLEMQEDKLKLITAKEKLRIVWLRETHSGRFMNAPELTKLRNWIEAGGVAKVYVYSWDRLGRNMLKGCEFVELCLKEGVQVISYLEPYDLRTPEGLAQFHDVMRTSQLMLARLSINTANGLALAKKRGTFVGGSKGRWISKKTLNRLPKIYKMHEAGLTLREISKALEMDERTVAKVVNTPYYDLKIRKRTWDQ